jgi:O-antigen/teichoic acid export membrane protein
MRIDQIMIKEMLGEYEVGIYSAAVRLSEAFYFIPMLITASLFPAILNAKNQSEELYKQRLQRLYTFMVWMAIAIALPMTFLADWLILMLFGQAYQEAGQVLMIHIWASIFVFLGAAGAFYTIENIAKIFFYKISIGVILNVLLNYYLIPYGVVYAAISTLIAQAFANYLADLLFNKSRSQFLLKTKAFLGSVN